MKIKDKKLFYSVLSSGVLIALFAWLVLPDFTLQKLILWGILSVIIFLIEGYFFKKTPKE